MNPILVIGATGNVGSQVVSQLAAAGARVRALTRNPGNAQFASTVETVAGDLTRPETLDTALDSVEMVFLVWTAPPSAVDAALERIVQRARRIVLLTAPLKTPHPFFQQPNPLRDLYARIEQVIEASDMEWTFVRPGIFAVNAVAWWSAKIRQGETVRWPYLQVATAPIHEADIAAVAVRSLTEDGHAGAEYVITGPESLTQAEQLEIIARVAGRPIAYEEISPEAARTELLPVIPAGAINMLLNAWSAAAGQPALITSTVHDVTGSPARSFAQWAGDHAAEFSS
jgi:uncharacterized protein YbjT (DUF2867 family)